MAELCRNCDGVEFECFCTHPPTKRCRCSLADHILAPSKKQHIVYPVLSSRIIQHLKEILVTCEQAESQLQLQKQKIAKYLDLVCTEETKKIKLKKTQIEKLIAEVSKSNKAISKSFPDAKERTSDLKNYVEELYSLTEPLSLRKVLAWVDSDEDFYFKDHLFEVKAIREACFSSNHQQLGNIYYQLAHYYCERKECQEAELYAKKALKAYSANNATSDLADTYNLLADIYSHQKKTNQTTEMYKLTVQTYQVCSEIPKKDLACCYFKFGCFYKKNQDYCKAETMLKNCKKLEETLDISNSEKAVTLHKLGSLYEATKKYSDSERMYLECVETLKKDPKSLELAWTYMKLGDLMNCQSMFQQAETYFLKCKNTVESIVVHKNEDLASTYYSLGTFYLDSGDLEKSLNFLLKAKAFHKFQKPEHKVTIVRNLGKLHSKKKDFNSAENLYLEFLGEIKEHPDLTAQMHYELGCVYCEQNKLQEAETALTKATTSKELLRSVYYELSKVYSSSGEKTKAEHYLLQFKEIEEKQSPKSINLAETYYALGELYTQSLKYRDAELMLLSCLEIEQQVYGEYNESIARTFYSLGELYHCIENYRMSSDYFTKYSVAMKSVPNKDIAELKRRYRYIHENFRQAGWHSIAKQWVSKIKALHKSN